MSNKTKEQLARNRATRARNKRFNEAKHAISRGKDHRLVLARLVLEEAWVRCQPDPSDEARRVYSDSLNRIFDAKPQDPAALQRDSATDPDWAFYFALSAATQLHRMADEGVLRRARATVKGNPADLPN